MYVSMTSKQQIEWPIFHVLPLIFLKWDNFLCLFIFSACRPIVGSVRLFYIFLLLFSNKMKSLFLFFGKTKQFNHAHWILSTFIKLPFVIKSFVLSIFEWRLATEWGTSQSLVMTQIVFAIYYLLGVVLVPGAWVSGTRNFVESKTGASFGFEQEGSYMGARFSLPEIKIKYIQRAILTFCIQGNTSDGTLTNIIDPDEMRLNVEFDQGLR